MRRVKDWRARLNGALAEARGKAFEPGAHDCGLFSAAIVAALTGFDHGAEWRGRYKTLTGGYRRLTKQGFRDVAAYWAAHLPEIHPSQASDGDLVSFDTPDGCAMGVVSGDRAFVLMPSGLGTMSFLEANRAFRV